MKIVNIVYLRIFAMLCILAHHCLCVYTTIWGQKNINIIYDFLCNLFYYMGIPLFVGISGFLYKIGIDNGKYVNTRQFIFSKIKRIIVPYLIWNSVSIIIYKQPWITLFYGLYHVWFLLMIFNIFVIFSVTKKYWSNLSMIGDSISIITLLFISIGLSYIKKDISIFCIGRTISYLFVFFSGILAAKYKHWVGFCHLFYVSLVVSILLLCICVLLHSFYGSRYIHKISICIFIFSVLKVKFIFPSPANTIMSLDKCSMGIYILHFYIIWSALRNPFLNKWYISHNYIAPILFFLMMFFLCWFLTVLFNRHQFSKYLFG